MSYYYYSTWGTSTSPSPYTTSTPKYVEEYPKPKKKEVQIGVESDNEVVLFNPEDLVL